MKHSLKKRKIDPEALWEARSLYKNKEEKFQEYIDELLDWNQKINLISRNVSRETVKEHVVHSLIAASLGLISGHDKWIDSGSGGGLPGIPLAISFPEYHWVLNDNVRKKMTAVEQIVQSLSLDNAEVLPKSISLAKLENGTGIVTKHAFKIPDLFRLLGDKPWSTILMWKGVEGAHEELKKSGKKVDAVLYEFNFGENEPFYEGKGILKITR